MKKSIIDVITESYSTNKRAGALQKFVHEKYPSMVLDDDPHSPYQGSFRVKEDDLYMYFDTERGTVYALTFDEKSGEEVSASPTFEAVETLKEFASIYKAELSKEDNLAIQQEVEWELRNSIDKFIKLTMPSEFDLAYNEDFIGFDFDKTSEGLQTNITQAVDYLKPDLTDVIAVIVRSAKEAITISKTPLPDNFITTSTGELDKNKYQGPYEVMERADILIEVIEKKGLADPKLSLVTSHAGTLLSVFEGSRKADELKFSEVYPLLAQVDHGHLHKGDHNAIKTLIDQMIPANNVFPQQKLDNIVSAAKAYLLLGGTITTAEMGKIFPLSTGNAQAEKSEINIAPGADGRLNLYLKKDSSISLYAQLQGKGLAGADLEERIQQVLDNRLQATERREGFSIN